MKQLRNFTLIALFLITILLISIKAQNRSASVNLEGTQWEGLVQNFNTLNGLGTRQFIYVFDKGAKVSLKLLALNPPAPSSIYSGITGKYEPTINVTPIASLDFLDTGTYQIKGRSIYLNFFDHSITAVVDGKIMKGEIIYKKSKEKEDWLAKKTIQTINSSSSNRIVSYPNVIKNADGKFSPASGFRWVNPCELDDFQVESSAKPHIRGISPKDILEPLPNEEEVERVRKAFNFYYEAQLAEKSGNYNDAVKNYSAAIAITPENARLYFWRARTFLNLLNYRNAIWDYDKFIDIYISVDSECKAKSQKNDTYVSFATGELSIENVYFNRGIAKEKFGDKSFACLDFRKSCNLGNGEACEKVKRFCN